MGVKLEDVARRAGVSKATVSLALNGSDRINAQTRARIERLAMEMGYRPNPYARKLAMRKSRQIGLILPDIENGYYASLAKHIFNDLTASGYGLSISLSMNSRLTERRAVSEMIENRVDGLLLAPLNVPNADAGYLEMLDDAGIPTVLVTSSYPGLNRPTVMCDLYGGMRMMLEELYRRGYRKMALLTGPEGAYCLDLRKAAYLDFLREKGLEYQKIRHMDGVGYDDAVSGTGALMDAEAILCVNDMMALGVVNELRRCGRSVPDDAAVTGFDDSAFATVSPVPIASVRQDLRRMAAEAVERILNLAQDAHKDDSAGGMIPCELVLRASVGKNERL